MNYLGTCLSSMAQLILLLLPVPRSIMICLFLKVNNSQTSLTNKQNYHNILFMKVLNQGLKANKKAINIYFT